MEGKDFRVFFKAIQNDPDGLCRDHRLVSANCIFSRAALDILSRMLKLDLRERCSASEALRHPFFSKVYKCEEQVKWKSTIKTRIPYKRFSLGKSRSVH